MLLLAAALWGFAVSTRIIAVAAGGIVGLYGLLRFRQRALFPLTAYTLTASIFAYITWPLFWVYGLRGLWDGLLTLSQWPYIRWVLFEGNMIPAEQVPPTYIPKLLLLQFTEPAVVLMLIGAVFGLVLIVRNQVNRVQLGLVYLWIGLPLAYNMANDFPRYANFRQFLFIIPPLFVFAALALDQASRWFKDKAWLAALGVLIALPGIVSLFQLHPYQYIYYNQFVGGVEGAFREYELDYWKTSYIDAWEYINENIPEGSRILSQVIYNFDDLYAEKEYTFADIREVNEQDYGDYDYALLDTRLNQDLGLLPDAPLVYELKVDNATLIMIKKIP